MPATRTTQMSATRPEFLFLFLSCLISVSFVSAVYNRIETLPGCPSKCGSLDIPYPFGVGENCSISRWTKIKCNTTFNPPKPFIGQIEVVNLSLTELRIKSDVATSCFDKSGSQIQVPDAAWFTLKGSPFTFSSTQNKLFAIGCDTFLTALLEDDTPLTCRTSCDSENSVAEGSCTGIGCCQAPLPKKLNYIYATVGSFNNYTFVNSFDTCGSAFMAEEANYTFKSSDFTNPSSLPVLPIVINIAVDNKTCEAAKQNATAYACKENSYCHESVDGTGYLCSCNKGFEGNPYIKQSCQDVNECEDPNNNPCKGICTNTYGSYECSCPLDFYGDGTKNGSGCTKKNKKFPVLQISLGLGFGFLFLLIGGLWLFFTIKKRSILKQKEKFFHQNGGLLLQQQLTSKEGGVESVKVFTSDELKLATNNYSEDRILGRGGSGTVYKGILPDLRIVAIKKSRFINESQLKEFINEVIILTQINHRNVVKLLGVCLEAKVPMLVYEFVSNGTLLYHLHKKDGTISSLTWQDRLRIASETATALAYLHSAASIPVFHRDVKSANILLDDNYTAKVADFGASRLNPTDETQISTLIQGTMGYLDPSYYESGQLTAKSDVYSFGVVVAELLTGEKPVSFERPQEQRDLATYFTMSFKENGVIQLLHASIVNEGYTEEALEVAELANKCLYANGEERPTMKEVSMKLEGLRGFQKHQPVRKGDEKSESPRFEEDKDLYSIPSTGVYSTNGYSEYSSDMETRQSMNAPR